MMIMGIGRCNLGLVIYLENGDWILSIYCWCMHVDVTFHYVIGLPKNAFGLCWSNQCERTRIRENCRGLMSRGIGLV